MKCSVEAVVRHQMLELTVKQLLEMLLCAPDHIDRIDQRLLLEK